MQRKTSNTMPGRNGGTLRRLQPGESGNPKGKPKGIRNISTILREYLEAEDKKSGGNGEALNIPTAKLVKLLTSAKNEAVQLKAIQEAMERLEGKVEENINLNTGIPKIEISFRDAD
jgi:hypothetical protein